MINRILNYFGITTDWERYESYTGKWDITYTNAKGEETKYCTYNIYYSPKTKKYKLKYYGHRPEQHKMFNDIIQLVKQLQKEKDYEL